MVVGLGSLFSDAARGLLLIDREIPADVVRPPADRALHRHHLVPRPVQERLDPSQSARVAAAAERLVAKPCNRLVRVATKSSGGQCDQIGRIFSLWQLFCQFI